MTYTHTRARVHQTHKATHAHRWKKTLALRPHRVHVRPSGIINAMLMNMRPRHVERRGRRLQIVRKRDGEMEAERWETNEDNGILSRRKKKTTAWGGVRLEGRRLRRSQMVEEVQKKWIKANGAKGGVKEGGWGERTARILACSRWSRATRWQGASAEMA